MPTTKPRLAFAATIICLLSASLALAEDAPWIPLFDGQSLDGWEKVGDEASIWEVKEGALCGSGPASMLVSTKGPYKNFRYRAEIKINDGGNSGLYFRTTPRPGFSDGYEAQIDSTHTDPIRTGSLYGMCHVYQQLVKPDAWFTYELQVRDDIWRGREMTRIKVTVDGNELYEYLDFAKSFAEGHFAFQQHDPGSRVEIRKVEVLPLDDQGNPIQTTIDLPATDDGLPGAGPIRRYDWFRELWTQRRSAWAARVAEDQHALVFLGDSITQGWGDDMGGSFADVKVANRGISGDTTRGMLIRLKDDVLALNPRGVVVLMGTNDLEEHAEPETIAENLKLILAELKKHDAEMPVIVCQVFPSSELKQRPADKIKRVNDLYAAVVKTEPQVTLVDTWTLFANENGDAKEAEFPDLLHPNQAGYAMWAAALRPVLATLDFLETADDAFTPEPGFVSLFNGRDLSGWGTRDQKTLEKQADFDGRTASDDGRYVARHGRLIVTTPPEGRRVQQLWTTREFPKNFVLKLEFRATPNADSGVFIRQPQLQCRDYPLAGPYKDLRQYRPQDWNELVVIVKGNTAHCTCNGEVLEESLALPATGPIGLEGDRGQMEYRRIRLMEVP